MTTSLFDEYMERVSSGDRLSAEEIAALAAAPDILSLGMLADALRRRLRGTHASYLRVAIRAHDQPFDEAVPTAAREIRLTGAPDRLETAVAAVAGARAGAGGRPVSGFAWPDIEQAAQASAVAMPVALRELRDAGLDAFAELPLDRIGRPADAIEQLQRAGFGQLRLTIGAVPSEGRTALLLGVAGWQDQFGCIQTIAPLPMTLNALRPTTGYDDVKAVAIARLAAPNIPSVQVDWMRYGPKLAQVALTFGADDVDGVSADDEAPDGRRRAPVAEIRRNIEAAGFVAVERDGRFIVVP